jgi:tRNA-splicing endonuclease subunit Sen54
LLASWHGSSYQSLFAHLRIIPAGHSQPINNPPTTQPSTAIPATTTYNTGNQYEALEENPYLPFFHVWQPSVNWSRKDWLKGTDEGLSQLPPNYWLAVVK